jgi:predicted nucleic acid-binding protein
MNEIVVVDASLAIKWVLIEVDSARATTLLDRWASEGKEIIAPALFTYEVTNILHR